MFELTKEKTIEIPVFYANGEENATPAMVDEDYADLASLRWRDGTEFREEMDEEIDIDDPQAYTEIELLGTKVHVRLDDLILARHLGAPVVTAGVRPGGHCPNCRRAD